MTSFKQYRNRQNPEKTLEARLREDGVFEVKDKNCPFQGFFGPMIVEADNFNEHFEEVSDAK